MPVLRQRRRQRRIAKTALVAVAGLAAAIAGTQGIASVLSRTTDAAASPLTWEEMLPAHADGFVLTERLMEPPMASKLRHEFAAAGVDQVRVAARCTGARTTAMVVVSTSETIIQGPFLDCTPTGASTSVPVAWAVNGPQGRRTSVTVTVELTLDNGAPRNIGAGAEVAIGLYQNQATPTPER
ncbi:hypothetical protein [Kribbella sp. DT2]|uniref:hypothetical protein n=1 Tax=Kribbella sp. DT2 TaxID=3393427 RepID=UPI003CFB96A6